MLRDKQEVSYFPLTAILCFTNILKEEYGLETLRDYAMTFSLDKLKTFLPSTGLFDDSKEPDTDNNEDSTSIFTKIEPEVGFKLLLEGVSKSVGKREKDRPAELHVHLIGARHLPGTFGLRSIKGYMVKVKLFPGIAKFDSDIQTSSWPKFEQIFKFDVVEPSHRLVLFSVM